MLEKQEREAEELRQKEAKRQALLDIRHQIRSEIEARPEPSGADVVREKSGGKKKQKNMTDEMEHKTPPRKNDHGKPKTSESKNDHEAPVKLPQDELALASNLQDEINTAKTPPKKEMVSDAGKKSVE